MLRLPDLLGDWPWPRAINPHYERVAGQSAAWLRAFGLFPAHVQRAFDKCNFGRSSAARLAHSTC